MNSLSFPSFRGANGSETFFQDLLAGSLETALERLNTQISYQLLNTQLKGLLDLLQEILSGISDISDLQLKLLAKHNLVPGGSDYDSSVY